jgi:medium-chain acyl-[acyl-carrier-protein] hydrolase
MSADPKWFLGARRAPLPNAAKVRLFCLPYAGGGGSTFMSWSRELPSWLEVVAVQPPGRENRFREPPLTDMTVLTAELERAMQPFAGFPFVLFGYSVGGLVAHELALRLRRNGRVVPRALVVAACRPPHRAGAHPDVERLDDRELFDVAQARYGGVPDELRAHDELLRLHARALRADLQLLLGYEPTPAPALDCPLTVIHGDADDTAPAHVCEEWAGYTRGQFRIHRVPGGHFFLREQRAALLSILCTDVEAVAA